MSYTLQVKPGQKAREVVWLDLSQYKVVRDGTNTLLLMSLDGRQCFSILKSGQRRRVLESLGYDPAAVWKPEEVLQQ
jgi:hypothetical protein